MQLDSILGRGRAAVAPVAAAAGPVAVQTRQLYAASSGGANAIAAPIAAQTGAGSGAVAAGVLAFAAVGVLVAMRFAFRGAVS